MKRRKKLVAVMVFMLGLTGSFPGAAAMAPETLNVGRLPEWEVTNSSYGSKLLLSDSPEMVDADGILYQDQVAGDIRLFFYHVNATRTAKLFDVVVENEGSEAAQVTVRQYGLGGPGYIWMAVGKEAMASYLAGGQQYQFSVPARETRSLAADISDTAVLPNMLINGIYDFTVDQPVTVKVVMMPLLADGGEFSRTAAVLPADKYHLRGTFKGADRQLVPLQVFDAAHDWPVAITLADNMVDPYLTGIDATDGSEVVNYGNYGVVYHIFLPSQNGRTAYYLSPRGGDYAGAVGIKYRDIEQNPVATPAGRLYFGGRETNEFALLGTFTGDKSLWLTFSPPGASNLPVKIVIVPQPNN